MNKKEKNDKKKNWTPKSRREKTSLKVADIFPVIFNLTDKYLVNIWENCYKQEHKFLGDHKFFNTFWFYIWIFKIMAFIVLFLFFLTSGFYCFVMFWFWFKLFFLKHVKIFL